MDMMALALTNKTSTAEHHSVELLEIDIREWGKYYSDEITSTLTTYI